MKRDSQRQVYKIDEDWGRGYGVEALFTAHPEDVKVLVGHTIYYGEICGKHSEIDLTIDEDTISLLEAPPEVIEWLEKNVGRPTSKWSSADVESYTISGHNPFDYLDESNEESMPEITKPFDWGN